MARIDLTSIGIRIYWGLPNVLDGSKPAYWYDYVYIKGLKEIPEMNPAPDTIETTTFDEEEYKTYVEGLKDIGGALGFTFNLTQEFIEQWDALFEGTSEDKTKWFLIDVPAIDKLFCFKGIPIPVGLSSVNVNEVLEATAYIIPVNEPEWVNRLPNLTFSETLTLATNNGVASWNSILNGKVYKVYKAATSGGTRELIGSTTGLLFDYSFLPSGTYYLTVDVEARNHTPKKSNEKKVVIS